MVGSPRGFADPSRVESELEERLPQRHAVLIGQRPPGVIPRSRNRRGPQEGLAEARPLFVRESRDLDRERQRHPRHALTLLAQEPNDFEGHEHADDAVETPRILDGVQVRTDHERRRRGVRIGAALDASELVSRGVLPGSQAHLTHPFGREPIDPGVLG